MKWQSNCYKKLSLPFKCSVSPTFYSSESNISEFNGLQWFWKRITHLIVFHIIILWGLFLLFRLLAELIPFLSQHVGGVASNQLTNTDHRQAGGKALPTPSDPLSLKLWVGAVSWTVHKVISNVLIVKMTFSWTHCLTSAYTDAHQKTVWITVRITTYLKCVSKFKLERIMSQCLFQANLLVHIREIRPLNWRPHTTSKCCLPTSSIVNEYNAAQ